MTSPRRVLLVGLDGFDAVLAQQFAEEGLLPNFARLQKQSASFNLDHGRDKYSGLSWEHLSSGIRPSDGGRWSAVTFNQRTYQATQDHTVVRPFLTDLSGVRSVIFDFPYFDLAQSPNVRGITSWGAHDPGVASAARPDGLQEEMTSRFGPYPAPEWIYGFCWPSAQKAHAAGEALAQAVKVRSQASRWLLQQRLPDWDLGVVVISEPHSAIEPLWHGVDSNHPLHGLRSAPAAAAALRKVYPAVDDLIGDLYQAFPDTVFALVAMHGMGQNDSETFLPWHCSRNCSTVSPSAPHTCAPSSFPSFCPMVLRCYRRRRSLGRPSFSSHPETPAQAPPACGEANQSCPCQHQSQSCRCQHEFQWRPRLDARGPLFSLLAENARVCSAIVLRRTCTNQRRGREARGKIRASEYAETCQQIREVVSECRNLSNGKPVVSEVYCPKQNPHEVGPSEADVYIVWEGAPLGLSHPRLGKIGPLPYLRTGGHTGKYGFLNIVGDNIPAGQHGVASSFDVVPTIIELLGQSPLPQVSGDSLLPLILPVPSMRFEVSD